MRPPSPNAAIVQRSARFAHALPRILAAAIATLFVANMVGLILRFGLNQGWPPASVLLFNFDTEGNFPTAYSAAVLALAGVLFAATAQRTKPARKAIPWVGLALIFLFLAFDEAFQIHERLVLPTRERFGTSGLFFFAWFLPYGLALIVLGLIYAPFLRTLPRLLRRRMFLSAVVFLVGAVGFEMLGGRHVEVNGKGTLTYALLYTIEELLEMVGVALLVTALASSLASGNNQTSEPPQRPSRKMDGP